MSIPPDGPGGTGQQTLEAERPVSGDKKPGRRRQRPSVLTVIGVVLVAAGLSCLGWVAYQYFGTNVVSEKAFQTERGEIRKQWDAQNQADPDHKKKATDAESNTALPGQAIALMRIPAFGKSYEIPVLQGTTLDVLARGIGHYDGTAAPGQVGNFAVAGHRVTHGQPFNRLLELSKGDTVIVETRTAIYTYALDEAPKELTVKDTDTWVIDPVPGKTGVQPTQALLTMTTCQDLFHSPDRSVGFGHLVSTQLK